MNVAKCTPGAALVAKYPRGRRRMFRPRGFRGLGQLPGLEIPGIDKPQIPGYVRDEDHIAAINTSDNRYGTLLKITWGVGVGALVIGALVGRAMK